MYIDSMNRLSNIPPISEQLKQMKADVNANKGGLNNQRFLTLSIEREFSLCERSCIYFKDNIPFCDWIRLTSSQMRCNSRVGNNREIGVDGKKIKYKKTSDEISLRKQTEKFMKVALKVDREEKEKEKKAAIIRRKRRVKAALEAIKQDQIIMEDDVLGKPKYNITSLI